MCAHIKGGFFFVTRCLSRTRICWEPPRCPEEEKGPGSISLLEDIRNEQTGREQGGHNGLCEHQGATKPLTFGNRAGWPTASPIPIRGRLRGRKRVCRASVQIPAEEHQGVTAAQPRGLDQASGSSHGLCVRPSITFLWAAGLGEPILQPPSGLEHGDPAAMGTAHTKENPSALRGRLEPGQGSL